MAEKKEIRKYVFTVEGQTEKWYLEWLRDKINAAESSGFRVSIVLKVEQNPLKYAKSITAVSTPHITHLCDIEGSTKTDIEKFEGTLERLHDANKMGKKIDYQIGYSNLTFELWMILHKLDCNKAFSDRSQYLTQINRAYSERFESLKQYKEEQNFKRCLNQLELADVFSAVKRAKKIMDANESAGKKQTTYKSFKYYRDNPALNIWEMINQILTECEVH